MFTFVRQHNKIIQFLLALLIVPSFVLMGVDQFSHMGDKTGTVATVNGKPITQTEWDNAHKQEVDQIRQSDPKADIKLLDSPEAKYASLERLVRERVMAAAAADSRLVTSDSRVARELQQDPLIASLKGPDGKLDINRYRDLLKSQGMTPEQYEAGVRADLSRRQSMLAVINSAQPAPAMTGVTLGALLEKRDVQLARFEPAAYAGKVSLSDADLDTYYKAHTADFQSPESINVDYIVLDMDAVKKNVAVNESDLKTYYDQNKAQLAGKQERRASHILINAPSSASADERAKAKAQAEALLAEVKKSPASFAEVARKNSQDTGSAAQGGDLGFFGKGAMVKPFEDAAFAMKKGDISGVVESDFGYHIIQLTDVKGGDVQSFEQMRPQLEADVRQQLAQKQFADAAEQFNNGVYEQSDSLKPVADKLKLPIQTATGVLRQPAPGAKGPLANPKFLAELFSNDAIDKKRNTKAEELGGNQLVSGRVTQHTPARTKAFDEVKDQVRQRVMAQKLAAQAKADGEAKLAAWKAAPASAVLGESMTVSREQPNPTLSPALMDAILSAPAIPLPAWRGVDLGDAGYAVIKVNKITAGTGNADTIKSAQNQYLQLWTEAEARAYYDLLAKRYKVEMKVKKPAPGAVASKDDQPAS